MKDIKIELHLFEDPEKPEHTEFVDTQCKLDFFKYAYGKVSMIEMLFLRRNEEYFKLKDIRKCENDYQLKWYE